MNRITDKLNENKKLLSLYFTAGFPEIDDTADILIALQESGVDMIEIGLPFSDPLADGPTIQASSQIALKNGMTTEKLFQQLKHIREDVNIPLLIMGYFNPILQYGVENFCAKCKQVDIDGLIIPDLPVEEYLRNYQDIFRKYDLLPIFLVTPQTTDERIRLITSVSEGFIYMVSSSGVTGSTSGFGESHKAYFKRISDMDLCVPLVVGFGISDPASFKTATQYAQGAIIGSAFIKHLNSHGKTEIHSFVKSLR